MEQLIENIDKHWHEYGHLNENQRNFLIDFFSKIEAKNCLEIGFATGRSASVTLNCLKPEKLISIDIDLDYMKARYFSEKMQSEFKNFQVIESDTLELFNTNWLSENFPDGIDYAFIDGGHTYDVAYNDISKVYEHLNQEAVMIVDDYMSGKPDGAVLQGVTDAVNDFCKSANITHGMWYQRGKGFAIITKQ